VPSFLLLALKAMNQHLERLSLGSTIATIGMADIKSLQIPLPPVHVQNAIVDYVSKEAAKLDQLAAKVEAAVERLTEYRQTLITSAVTGKIDVRGMA
jgi:type I restriction enzyme, S subunit